MERLGKVCVTNKKYSRRSYWSY